MSRLLVATIEIVIGSSDPSAQTVNPLVLSVDRGSSNQTINHQIVTLDAVAIY
jgi:hypothetical protein